MAVVGSCVEAVSCPDGRGKGLLWPWLGSLLAVSCPDVERGCCGRGLGRSWRCLVRTWKGAVVAVAWVAPGGVLAFVAAGGVVAVAGVLHRGRRRRRREEGPRSGARFPPACAILTGKGLPHIQGGSGN